MTRALLVGLGTIARTHAAVLRQRPDVELVGGVDPDPADWFEGQVWSSLEDAVASAPQVDLVVVTSPTATHVDLVAEALSRTDARVLCEKPLAATTSEVDRLAATYGADALAARVAVTHHFAFSPEVEWARALALRHPEWGPPTRILSVFNDAYAHLPASRLDSVVSSWVDSGPNQLSVVAAFLPDGDWQVVSHAAERERSVTVLGGGVTLMSNWLAADSSKQTTIEYAGRSRVELRLDHTSMTVAHLADGQVVEHAGYTGTASRKHAHYLGVYDAVLAAVSDPRLGVPLSRRIAAALEDAGRRAAVGSGFTSIEVAGSPRLRPSEEVGERARAARDEVGARLARLGVQGDLELSGASSTPGALTKGDVDLHLRVAPDHFDDVLERLDRHLPRTNLHAWAATLAVYAVPGDHPTELAVTPVDSEHDRRFRIAWERLRSDPGLLEEYNQLKLLSFGGADYDRRKSDFFSRITGQPGGDGQSTSARL